VHHHVSPIFNDGHGHLSAGSDASVGALGRVFGGLRWFGPASRVVGIGTDRVTHYARLYGLNMYYSIVKRPKRVESAMRELLPMEYDRAPRCLLR